MTDQLLGFPTDLPVSSKLPEKNCDYCHKTFSPKTKRTLYCSPRCGGLGFKANWAKKNGKSYMRDWKDKRKKAGICENCSNLRIDDKYCKSCRERHRKFEMFYGRQLREQVIAAYGGKCECCSEADPRFLCVDHKNNNGASHRKALKWSRTGKAFYRWLRRHGFPRDEYSLLCFNCNCGKRLTGICPHQRERIEAKLL